MVALELLSVLPQRLVEGLSFVGLWSTTTLPGPDRLAGALGRFAALAERREGRRPLVVEQSHASDDPVIPLGLALRLHDTLTAFASAHPNVVRFPSSPSCPSSSCRRLTCRRLRFFEFQGGHSLCPEALHSLLRTLSIADTRVAEAPL